MTKVITSIAAIKAQERVIRDLNDQLADACSGMKALSAELRNASR